MTEYVAVVACENYEPNNVYNAIERIFKLLSLEDLFKNESIILKPNLCLPVDYSLHLTTHPEIVKQTARVLMKLCAIREITVSDTCIGNDTMRRKLVWEKTGMNQLIEELKIKKNMLDQDIEILPIQIQDLLFNVPISRFALNGCIINLPKLKTHEYMLLSGCVKNLYGLLAGDAKKYFHGAAQNKVTFAKLLQALYKKIPCLLHITDAIVGIEGDGPGMKGVPRKIGVIVAGRNGIAVDHILARLINAPVDSVLTNHLWDSENIDIEIVGDSFDDFVKRDYKLPEISNRNDRITEHAISAKALQLSVYMAKCIGCNECIRNCPVKAISSINGVPVFEREKCIKCLVCSEVCCRGAIEVKRNAIWKLLNGNSK